jgi:hypothetical protein
MQEGLSKVFYDKVQLSIFLGCSCLAFYGLIVCGYLRLVPGQGFISGVHFRCFNLHIIGFKDFVYELWKQICAFYDLMFCKNVSG